MIVRQLAEVNISLEVGDWMETELPVEIKKFLHSILRLEIDATRKMSQVRERLELCEKQIIKIADMTQQLYG